MHHSKLRDPYLHLLGLQFSGLDADFRESVQNIVPESLNDLRIQAQEIAKKILEKQSKNQNTYFIDVEAISKTGLAVLVSDVISAR